MNTRASFCFVTLFVTVQAALAAENTPPAAPSHAPPGGFHQKIPWSVGSGMEGTITNVVVADGRIHFQFTGWFWLRQYPEGGPSEQEIKVDCRRGVAATVNQPESFVAMSADWRAGSVRNDKRDLVKILRGAAERGTVIKFSFMRPKLDFAKDGFELAGADVWRVTDPDLR